MNDMKSEVEAIFQSMADAYNEVLNAELDKMRAGEDVTWEGSVRRFLGFHVIGIDENPNGR